MARGAERGGAEEDRFAGGGLAGECENARGIGCGAEAFVGLLGMIAAE